jgi:zinc protease
MPIFCKDLPSPLEVAMRFLLILATLLFQFLPGYCSSTELALDSKIVTGQLPNGLTYYVRENGYKKDRAYLKLIVKVGSIYEKEEEKGIAHFIEHLVFRGTQHFTDGEAIRYLESLGSWLGIDANASTTFDKTVFEFEIPVGKGNSLEKTLLLLSDMASTATFDADIIEKEKTVVLDELHQGSSSPGLKMGEKLINQFLSDTPYAHHLPGGLKEVVQNATPALLQDFYKGWYTPDRMAIIAVGDFDGKAVISMIESLFGTIPVPEEKRAEPAFKVQLPAKPMAIVHVDPELTSTQLSLFSYYPKKNTPFAEGNLRQEYLESLLGALISNRLDEFCDEDDSPILEIDVDTDNLTSGISSVNLNAEFTKDPNPGLSSLSRELNHILHQGFTESEFKHTRKQFKTGLLQLIKALDQTKHEEYVETCEDHFLSNAPLLSRESAMNHSLELLKETSLEDVNAYIASSFLTHPFAILFATPASTTVTEKALLDTFSIKPPSSLYGKEFIRCKTLDLPPQFLPGQIVDEQHNEQFNITTWTLSNGVRVTLKPNKAEKDKTKIYAEAPGGLFSLSPEEYPSAAMATDYVYQSGLDNLPYKNLTKFLETHLINFSYDIDVNCRTIDLEGESKHLESFFQLLHGLFTTSTFDPKKWDYLVSNGIPLRAQLYNSPNFLFNEHVYKINTSDHFCNFNPDPAEADEKSARQIFKRYFGSPQPFHFIIVGDFDKEKAAPLVAQYLASLPAAPEPLPPPNHPVFPEVTLFNQFRKGQKSYVRTLITIPYNFKDWVGRYKNSYTHTAVEKILENRLLRLLREDMGNTYGVWVDIDYPSSPDLSYATIRIGFTSQEARYKTMVDHVFQEIDRIKSSPASLQEISSVQELLFESKKKNLESNPYWHSAIRSSNVFDIPLADLLDYPSRIAALTPDLIQQASQLFFSSPYYTVITHLPEAQP